jgi:beta-glucosidase
VTVQWGASASSVSNEGAHPESDWGLWEKAGRAPDSGQGNGFADDHDTDLTLFAAHGLAAFRLVVEWSRIEPEPGRHDVEAVERYRRILQAVRDHGLVPWVGLHHYSTPAWFVDAGSWSDDKARGSAWPRHVAFCGEAFGDLVAGWVPVYEPATYAASCWLTGTLPPGRRDPERFARTLRGLLLAHRDAWRELRGGPPVATALDVSLPRADDDSPEARQRVRTIEQLQWELWSRAFGDGVLAVPGLAEEEVPSLEGALDVLGVSYRGGVAITGDGVERPYPSPEFWADGLGDALRRAAEALPTRPLHLDGVRADTVEAVAEQVQSAVDDGVRLEQVTVVPAVDGYEWGAGYGQQLGLFTRQRTPRDTALWLAEHLGTG